MHSTEREQQQASEEAPYEAPAAEDINVGDGPAVTVSGINQSPPVTLR